MVDITTPTYRAWNAMRNRCNNPCHHQFADYGGRGIKVCRRWDTFDAFVEDMGWRPDGLTLERLVNHGHYQPSNCVWATAKEQARNRRSNRNLTLDGETMCASAWAERIGISRSALGTRLKRLPLRQALTQPAKQGNWR